MLPERQRLDLRRAPLIRLKVAKESGGERCYVLLQLHHIIADGQALKVIVTEVLAHLAAQMPRLLDPLPYRNHVAQSLAYARTHEPAAFFRGKLADVDEATAPFGLLDVRADGSRLAEAECRVEPEVAWQIRAQARRLGVSAATLFHAAWSVVVAHTSARDDVVFGSVLLGRLQGTAGAQEVLGMFINTLPLRIRLRDVTARGLVEQVQRELIELLGHEQASLALAQSCSAVHGSAPLFSALLNYRHSVDAGLGAWGRAEGIDVLAIRGFTNYPITVSVDDLGDAFSLTAQTDRRVDPQRILGYLHTAVRSLNEALDHEPQTPALGLNILPLDEQMQLVEHSSGPRTAYPRDSLVHQLFEDQVSRTPGAIAVSHEGRTFTYDEIDRAANRLAHLLISRGVRADALVAICMERSAQMVVGLLAILKAGGAYVPLDPNYPQERLHYMIQDAMPRVLLTQRSLRHLIPPTSGDVIVLDEVSNGLEGAAEHAPSAMHLDSTPQSLVYVIYTSGSTGRPKGTGMPHGAMVNLINWQHHALPFRTTARVVQFAALSFDVAFQEIFSTLCTGGTLVLLDEWIRRDPRALLGLLGAEKIERLFVPPLMLQGLAGCIGSCGTDLSALTDVITAGEQLRIGPEIIAFFDKLGTCRLHNHYGPTETHVVTSLTLPEKPQSWPTLPTIGRPIANTQVYVLDARRHLVPFGAIGEIYIAGDNVARGYVNRPDLTGDRFLSDPFATKPQARMYKSGDLGRWRADGTLEYLGRNDDQVKIRGFRIELGEVEAQLIRHPLVKQATVVVHEVTAGERRLVAYVTRSNDAEPTPEELQAHSRQALPEHMVPSAFVILDQLPVTPSGKVNRRALPAPDLVACATRLYQPPVGEVEETLAQLWEELLRVQQVGRDDDFFSLGGHSLVALQLIGRVQTLFSIELPIRLVFDFPRLQQLSEQVSELYRARLLTQIAEHGMEAEELLERVASMPESEVRGLLGEAAAGGRP
jgi:amino acid adenylation domain-containing protein